MHRYRMVSKLRILALLLLALTLLVGCSSLRTVVLHPIEKSDIFAVEKNKPFTSEKDGWFLSDFYVEEVMKAKVGK